MLYFGTFCWTDHTYRQLSYIHDSVPQIIDPEPMSSMSDGGRVEFLNAGNAQPASQAFAFLAVPFKAQMPRAAARQILGPVSSTTALEVDLLT